MKAFKRKGEARFLPTLMVAVGLLVIGLVSSCQAGPADPSSPGAVTSVSATATNSVAEPEPQPSQSPSPVERSLDHQTLLDGILYCRVSLDEAQATLAQIGDSGDTRFVAALIDTLRYRRALTADIGRTLKALTGQDLPADWFDWVEWAGKRPEIESFEGYPAWKGQLFAAIDPNFSRFLYLGVKIAPDSRVEEIVWGGVRVDGIPALDNPKMMGPVAADYLVPHERVFGVSINGDTRAYPARFLDWHEMFNDIVGGEPVSLAY